MAGNDKLALTDVLDVTIYDKVTNEPVLFLDTLQKVTFEITSESASIKGGRKNPELYAYDFGKECKASITNALLSPRSFQLLSGNAVKTGATTLDMRQAHPWVAVNGVMEEQEDLPLRASGTGAVELAFTPNEVASNIIVYEKNDDGGTKLTAGTLSGKTLTNASWANKELVVYYTFQSNDETETFRLTSDKFPSVYRFVGKTLVPNTTTGKNEFFQVEIPSFKFDSQFNLDFQAGEATPFDMNGKVLKSAGNTDMVIMKKWNSKIK